MRNLSFFVLGALAVLSGCSRARVTTEIKPGGAWVRTVMVSGQVKKEGGMNVGESVEDVFVLPQGSAWKSREEKTDTERTVTFDRSFVAGATVKGDLSLRGGEDAPMMLVNEATVTRLGPGRFEYRETLRWPGPPMKPNSIGPEEMAQFKAALPVALATDENVRALSDKTVKLAMPVLFGPGDPLLALGLMHPDLAARRAMQRVGMVMLKAMEEQFGDKIPPAQRHDIVRKLIEGAMHRSMPSKPDPAAGPPPSGGKHSGLVPLMFILKTPGKIVSSNGEFDEFTGEVFWAMFPEAAALEPLKLTAIVEVAPERDLRR